MKYDDSFFDNMSDDEIDEFFRPRKANSNKTLAPLYVYLILKEETDERRPLRQKDILAKLEQKEVCIERKALSRVIHLLEDSELGIESNRRGGVWYDPNEDSMAA